VKHDVAGAIESYEKAVACNSLDPRLFFELDVLYERGNVLPDRRLAMLETHRETVVKRNQSFLRAIMVLVLVGRYDEAIGHLANNFFHVREGGGEIHDVYVDAHLLRGLQYVEAQDFARALDHFQKASDYPENLSVGRPRNDRRAPQVAWHVGAAYEAQGDKDRARESYTRAADQDRTSSWPDARYYQALCLQKLDRNREAETIFGDLIETARKRLTETESADFFAKFGEEETKSARQAAAHYALGLGLLGQGEAEKAREEFRQAVELNRSHVWAAYALARMSGRK